MAVLIEATSVVLKAGSVLAKYPGGWSRFVADVPNRTLCADRELVRVGFMTPDDTKSYIGRLERHGFIYQQSGKAVDLVVVDQRRGFCALCDWAEYGHIGWQGDESKRVAACRLVGSASNDLITPDGWEYERSLSAESDFVPAGWEPEFMDFLRHEKGVDVYRDLRTGKEVYVGRTKS